MLDDMMRVISEVEPAARVWITVYVHPRQTGRTREEAERIACALSRHLEGGALLYGLSPDTGDTGHVRWRPLTMDTPNHQVEVFCLYGPPRNKGEDGHE